MVRQWQELRHLPRLIGVEERFTVPLDSDGWDMDSIGCEAIEGNDQSCCFSNRVPYCSAPPPVAFRERESAHIR